MAVTIAILVLVACLGLCLLPLLVGSAAGDRIEEQAGDLRAELERARDRALDGIREVDLDLAMGKMTERDHAALRAPLEAEALEAIGMLNDLDGAAAGKEAPAETGEAVATGDRSSEEPA